MEMACITLSARYERYVEGLPTRVMHAKEFKEFRYAERILIADALQKFIDNDISILRKFLEIKDKAS